MWIADGWKDYEVLDTSSGEKLERWGNYLLVRPDPQVIWGTPAGTGVGGKKTDIITAAPKAAENGNFFTSLKNGVFPTLFHLCRSTPYHSA